MKISTSLGLLISLLMIPGFVWAAEYYSIQAANFKTLLKAKQQCQILRKLIDQAGLEPWRIDKAGTRYVLRIGEFSQENQALGVLTQIKQIVPDAFLWKGKIKKQLTVVAYPVAEPRQKETPPIRSSLSPPSVPLEKTEIKVETSATILPKKSEREYSVTDGTTAPGNKKAEVENSQEVRQALLWGTILEVTPLPGTTLGLASKEMIYRLKVRVDKTEALPGVPNFLQDREQQKLILFSEVQLPFFIPEQKIKGSVEYKGDKYKRFYWIKQVEVVKS
jgi:hypothetical protein